MRKKILSIPESTRRKIFTIGALFIAAICVLRLSNILTAKKQTIDELAEYYMTPRYNSCWEKLNKEISGTYYLGGLLDDFDYMCSLTLKWNGETYCFFRRQYPPSFEYAINGIWMEIYPEKVFNPNVEKVRIQSYGNNHRISVRIFYNNQDEEDYDIEYADGNYIPNFVMEKKIRMTSKEICEMVQTGNQIFELTMDDMWHYQRKRSLISAVLWAIIALIIWMMIMLPHKIFTEKRFNKEETKEAIEIYEKNH